jgi:hypothetical protein
VVKAPNLSTNQSAVTRSTTLRAFNSEVRMLVVGLLLVASGRRPI